MHPLFPAAKAYLTAVVNTMPADKLLDDLREANFDVDTVMSQVNLQTGRKPLVDAYVHCVAIRDIDFDWQFNNELPKDVQKLWFKIEGLWEND